MTNIKVGKDGVGKFMVEVPAAGRYYFQDGTLFITRSHVTSDILQVYKLEHGDHVFVEVNNDNG